MSKIIYTVLFLCFLQLCSGHKVLLVFPFPGTSHSILGHGFLRHLLNAGHEVTYITAIPLKETPNAKLEQIDVSSNFDQLPSGEILDIRNLMKKKIDLYDLTMIFEAMYDVAKATILHEDVQRMLHDKNKEFDVVIAEWMYSELYSGFASVYNCPLIWSSSMEPHAMVLSLIDEAPNPAYSPDHMTGREAPLDFWSRAQELWWLLKIHYHKWARSSLDESSYKEAFYDHVNKRGNQYHPLSVTKYNASLMFGNSYVSFGQPLRLPQNYIPIVGYHIKEDVEPLPKDLQKIMDEAEHGVIYFSMGSMLKSHTMPEELKQSLVTMFSGLQQTVLWKFEEQLPNLPKNLHILKWAPQPSILAHPNCRLFITHGGLLSITETIHFGVPIISMPMFADQFNNANKAVAKGIGIRVDVDWQAPENLEVAIKKIMSNPSYQDNVKKLSFIHHNRPQSPGKAIGHWVNQVVKTKGAPHLRSPAIDMPLYQKMYLDLTVVVIVLLLVLYAVIIKLFRKMFVNNYKKKID